MIRPYKGAQIDRWRWPSNCTVRKKSIHFREITMRNFLGPFALAVAVVTAPASCGSPRSAGDTTVSPDGGTDGSPDGSAEGSPDGAPEGSPGDAADGSPPLSPRLYVYPTVAVAPRGTYQTVT